MTFSLPLVRGGRCHRSVSVNEISARAHLDTFRATKASAILNRWIVVTEAIRKTNTFVGTGHDARSATAARLFFKNARN